MALGNIKVDRLAVITKVEEALAEGEALVKSGTTNQVTLDAAAEKAQDDLNALGRATFSKSKVTVDVRSWNKTVTVNAALDGADARPLLDAHEKAHEAKRAASENEAELWHAQERVKEAKRDLALLNASSEVTINVKTAGFLGYFGG
jgi:hypothetical protein